MCNVVGHFLNPQKYLPDKGKKILPLSGETGNALSLAHFISLFDVFIMTPQILVNAASNKELGEKNGFISYE